jgi:hypothetical protein
MLYGPASSLVIGDTDNQPVAVGDEADHRCLKATYRQGVIVLNYATMGVTRISRMSL